MTPHLITTLYHPGDVVRVRDDIISSGNKPFRKSVYYSMSRDQNNYAAVNDRMAEFAGECVTIERIENTFNGPKYHIHEDGGMWYWTDAMFSGLADETDDHIIDPENNYEDYDWS